MYASCKYQLLLQFRIVQVIRNANRLDFCRNWMSVLGDSTLQLHHQLNCSGRKTDWRVDIRSIKKPENNDYHKYFWWWFCNEHFTLISSKRETKKKRLKRSFSNWISFFVIFRVKTIIFPILLITTYCSYYF